SPFSDAPRARLPGLRAPRPGDVIVFLAPPQASADGKRRTFVKRIVAVEGQTIEVRAKQVYIDGKPWDDPHATFLSGKPDPTAERPSNPLLRACGSLESGSGPNCAPYTVPPGHVFVMGDNREQSYDSRFWGPVPIGDIRGQALVIYWSWGTPERLVRWERIWPTAQERSGECGSLNSRGAKSRTKARKSAAIAFFISAARAASASGFFASSSPPAVVHTRASALTPSPSRCASSSTRSPPIDQPTSAIRGTARARTRRSRSEAMAPIVYPVRGWDDSPWPRTSTVTTVCRSRSATTCRSQKVRLAVQPWTRSTGGPPPARS